MNSRKPLNLFVKKSISILIRYCAAILIMWWLFSDGKINFNSLKINDFNYKYYLTAFVLIFISELISIYRFKLILALARTDVSALELSKLTLIGYGFSMLLPGALTGDLVKLLYVSKLIQSKRNALLCIMIDRGFGLMGLLFLSSIAIIFNWSEFMSLKFSNMYVSFIMLSTFASVAFLAGIFFASAYASNKILSKVNFLFIFQRNIKLILLLFIFAIIAPLIVSISFYMIGDGLHYKISLFQYFYAVPIILLSMVLPLTPGGVGVGQVASGVAFSWIGLNNVVSVADIVTVFQFMMVVFAITGIIIFFKNPYFKRK